MLCAPGAHAQGVQLDPGALLSLDSSGAKQGVYQILQFSPDGAELSNLATAFPVPFFGVMVGLTVIEGEVWTIGTGAIVARIDLDSGQMKDTFFSNVYSAEGLTRIESDLLIGAYSGQVKRQRTDGTSVWSIETGVPMTGIATDGTLIYCGNYQNGNIYVFDQAGNQQSLILTNIGGYSLSGLAYDELTGTLLATTGFGADDVRRLSLTGFPLETFTTNWSYLNDLDVVPNACTDLFVPQIDAGTSLSVTGNAAPLQPVAVCVALDRSASQPFAVGEFCGASLLAPTFGELQFLTASDAAGAWSMTTPIPPGITLPVHVQAFTAGACPTGCSSAAVSRMIE